MTSPAEVAARVEILEARQETLSDAFRSIDGDFHDQRPRINAMEKLIGALRATQIEHDKVLREHGTVLGSLVAGQAAQGKAIQGLVAGQERVEEILRRIAERLSDGA